MPASSAVSRREIVRRKLIDDIESGRLPPGHKVASIRQTASRLGSSFATVQQAFDQLESEGYLVKRHGSGTFVREQPEAALHEAAVLCMEPSGHVFGDLHNLLVKGLHEQGRMALVVDHNSDPDGALFLRALQSEADTVIVVGGAHFPFHLLEPSRLRGKHLIGVLDWETQHLRDRVHQVLVDHDLGNRLVADHLWRRGCRHAIVVGPDNTLHMMSHRPAAPYYRDRCSFLTHWQRLGGTCDLLPHEVGRTERVVLDGHHEPAYVLDAGRLVELVKGVPGPVGIFGAMDAHAWEAQMLLHEHAPELLARTVLVGYGNTPWSQLAHPPFPSVDWSLPDIAAAVIKVIELCHMGAPAEPIQVKIPPRLARGN